ncbi:hypothetical protein [Geomonas sp.]|uniref:hypothetical protein n=1 Tax=Geomonas sp. TaxID=2651584 RepID=UPI002B498F8E|nr:hypothetical protein [Geomonas sp.]HJV34812.1 hypothetical protein [Geomonas sp.]
MSSRIRQTGFLMALLASFAVSGCAHQAAPPEAAQLPEHTATLQGIEEDYDRADLQVDSTQQALEDLYVSPVADLQQAADSFRRNARMMLALGDPLIRHGDGMHYQGPTYLVERRELPPACPVPGEPMVIGVGTANLGGYFEALADDAWEVKRAYRLYQFDIEQISGVLNSNIASGTVRPVTVKGLELMVRKARIDSEYLKEALEAADGAIEQASAARPPADQGAMSSAAPPGPTAMATRP